MNKPGIDLRFRFFSMVGYQFQQEYIAECMVDFVAAHRSADQDFAGAFGKSQFDSQLGVGFIFASRMGDDGCSLTQGSGNSGRGVEIAQKIIGDAFVFNKKADAAVDRDGCSIFQVCQIKVAILCRIAITDIAESDVRTVLLFFFFMVTGIYCEKIAPASEITIRI